MASVLTVHSVCGSRGFWAPGSPVLNYAWAPSPNVTRVGWVSCRRARWVGSSMSPEIRLVELKLEAAYARVDVELPAPGHAGQRARCRAGRARRQAMLARPEGQLHAGVRREERQRQRPGRVGILVEIDNDCPGRAVDQGADGCGLAAGRVRL